MSKMTYKLGKGGATDIPSPIHDLDDRNLDTYAPDLDGRSLGVRFQPIEMISPSPFQVRRVFSHAEIEDLANSIREAGLIHEPKGRIHPDKPGWVELMPGEMRLRALKLLIERGDIAEILKQDGAGQWLIPIQILDVDDEVAERIVFAENDARVDLSPWEWALAWQQRREMRRARGLPHTIKDVAESHGKPLATVGEYLKVADTLSIDVLLAGGIVDKGEPDHVRMARIPLSALKGAAQAVDARGPKSGAISLLQALQRAGDKAATETLTALAGPKKPAGTESFQINIRQPLDTLSPKQAQRYLGRMSEALPLLAKRAAEKLDKKTARSIRSTLEATLRALDEVG